METNDRITSLNVVKLINDLPCLIEAQLQFKINPEETQKLLYYLLSESKTEKVSTYAVLEQNMIKMIFMEEYSMASQIVYMFMSQSIRLNNYCSITDLTLLLVGYRYNLNDAGKEIGQLIELITEMLNKISIMISQSKEKLVTTRVTFITHLKYLAIRLIKKEAFQEAYETDIYCYLQKKDLDALFPVEMLRIYLTQKWAINLSNSEVCYLTLHLKKIVSH